MVLCDQFDDVWFKNEGLFSEAEGRENGIRKKNR
jgi:hypothetical protein